MCAARDDGGKPRALMGVVAALFDHTFDKGHFSARAVELVGLSAKVERYRVWCWVALLTFGVCVLAQALPFTLIVFFDLFLALVKRWVA